MDTRVDGDEDERTSLARKSLINIQERLVEVEMKMNMVRFWCTIAQAQGRGGRVPSSESKAGPANPKWPKAARQQATSGIIFIWGRSGSGKVISHTRTRTFLSIVPHCAK